MITIKKLKIFSKYNGDVDMWARLGNKSDIKGEEWSLIDSLIQDLVIIKNGQASQDYIETVNERLLNNLDSGEAIDFLKSLAK
jgi:hypothetical protein